MEPTPPNKSHRAHGRILGIRSFVATFIFMLSLRLAIGAYFNGISRTLERRFDLRSRTLGILSSISDIVVILLVLVVGYFGKKAHIPRVLSFGALALTAGAICSAMPYFIFGPLHITKSLLINDGLWNATLGISIVNNSSTNHQLCFPQDNIEEAKKACDDTSENNDDSWSVLIWFILANVLTGIADACTFVLGMTYIDANASKEKLPLYLGFLNSAFAIAPIFGIGLAVMSLMQPESLVTSLIPQSDPRWIGCWWFGYIIIAILSLCVAFLMLLFPRQMTSQQLETSKNDGGKKELKNEELSTGLEEEIHNELQGVSASLKALLLNVPLVLMILANVSSIYILLSLLASLPRYYEIHFRQSAAMANVMVGILIGSSAISSFIGGLVMRVRKMALPAAACFAAFASMSLVVSTFITMFISCPSTSLAGISSDNPLLPMLECNTNCSCSTERRTYEPVCGSDGLNYFSPCHAGCMLKSANTSFSQCHCLPKDGEATLGYCDNCFGRVVFYSVITFIGFFVSALGRVPKLVTFLGLIPAEQKSLGLGISSFCTNLFAFIPAPIIFGHLIDTTCILWQSTCGSSGACIIYNTSAFRYLVHGFALFFMTLDSGLMTALTCLLHKRRNKEKMEVVSSTSINGQQDIALMAVESQAITAQLDNNDKEELASNSQKMQRESEENNRHEASLQEG